MAADVDIRLSFVGGIRSVHQGESLPFKVSAKNTGPSSQSITVLILLTDPSSTVQAIRKALEEARRHLEPPESTRVSDPSPEPPPLTANGADKGRSDPAPASRPGGPKVSCEEGEAGGWCITFPERSYRVRGLTPNGFDQLRVTLRVESAGRMHVDRPDLYSHRSLARE